MNRDDDPEALALIDVAMASGTDRRLIHVTLNDAGDLSAPPGSLRWAIAVRHELAASVHNHENDIANYRSYKQLMEQHNGYRQLVDEHGQPFPSYKAFCEARPPFGLGYEPLALEAMIAERKTAQARATEPKKLLNDRGPATREEKVSIYAIGINTRYGSNNAEYLTARIARDRPDILERMKAGEYKSVRAAAIDAGIVKVPTALEKLNRDWDLASPEEQAAFLARIRAEVTS